MTPRKLRYIASTLVNGHILNWLWRPRIERRRVRSLSLREALLRYLSPYIPAVTNIPEDPKVPRGPRRIFSVWLQGEAQAPPLVKACWRSIRENCPGQLVVLDGETIFDWISLPERIVELWKSGRMKNAHFTDICRIELLYGHGGVWMDATDFLPAQFQEWLWEEPFFVYLAGERQRGWHSFIQNCFIRADAGAYPLKVWRSAVHAYWEKEDSDIDYFVHQVLFLLCVRNNPACSAAFEAMPHLDQDPTHVLWFEKADDPFNEEEFRRICAGALFQKTDFKSRPAREPLPGSYAEHIIQTNWETQ